MPTPPTITVTRDEAETTMPNWVRHSTAGRWLWHRDLAWRVNASRATEPQYIRVVLREAQRRYDRWMDDGA